MKRSSVVASHGLRSKFDERLSSSWEILSCVACASVRMHLGILSRMVTSSEMAAEWRIELPTLSENNSGIENWRRVIGRGWIDGGVFHKK
jgi:hypothetical protein